MAIASSIAGSYCDNLIRQAAGADLQLHDAMLKNFISLAAGGMAAHVGTLVLTHLVPVPRLLVAHDGLRFDLDPKSE